MELNIDTGVEEFRVNGRGVLRFNPADPNLYHRFFAAGAELDGYDAALTKALAALDGDEQQRAAAGLALLNEYDGKIKKLLTGIFGAENDFDAILGGVNLAGVGANGKRVVQNLLEALTPILREGAERRLTAAADAASPGRCSPRRAGRSMTGAWGLPMQAELGGVRYAIRSDYRDVLELLRWLNGQADPALDQSERWYVAMRLFYPEFAALPQPLWPDATQFLTEFLAAGRREQPRPGPALMDWQQDAPLIAAGISKAAGQDVRTLPYLHWWSFLAWFDAIGEGSFATVVAIRDKLRRGKRLENWELDYYRTHRAVVELRGVESAEEQAERRRLLELLGG